jgi:lipid-binding SYLF domain-containing protein
MRRFIIGLLLLGLAVPALAIDKSDVDKRIRMLTTKLDEMQAKTDKRIPAENLRKANGIILLNRSKGGFIFGYQGGGALSMVKDARSGHWSAPAFLSSNEGSFGLQIGGQQSFTVILLMNTNATHALTDSTVNFGGEASGTAGNSSGKAEGAFTDDPEQATMVYSDASGFYGGAAFKGGSLSIDTEANVSYYGQSLTPSDILFGKQGKPTEAATTLVQKLDQFAQ